MKKTPFFYWWAFLFCLPWSAFGQQLADTTGLTIDALQVPNSPVFALMDLAPSTIDEPKVPSDFVTYIRNATDSFTIVPRSFGLEFAPAWVFGRDRIDFGKFASNRLDRNLWQSLTLSVGLNHIDNPDLPAGNEQTTQIGFGFKTSLCRGHLESTHLEIDQLYQTLDALNQGLAQNTEPWLKTDPDYKRLSDSLDLLRKPPISPDNALKIASLAQAIELRGNQLLSDTTRLKQAVWSKVSAQMASLKAQTAGIKMNRVGFKLDLAAGMATNFYDESIDNSQVARIGAWLTGGWVFNPTQSQTKASMLGLLRVLGNPAQLYKPKDMDTLLVKDNLYFDYGGRFILHNGKKFSCSAELLARVPINNKALELSSRYALNIDYQVSKTFVLSFQFGKNFDGTINKGGNLLAAIHLFSSLGRRGYDSGKMR